MEVLAEGARAGEEKSRVGPESCCHRKEIEGEGEEEEEVLRLLMGLAWRALDREEDARGSSLPAVWAFEEAQLVLGRVTVAVMRSSSLGDTA